MVTVEELKQYIWLGVVATNIASVLIPERCWAGILFVLQIPEEVDFKQDRIARSSLFIVAQHTWRRCCLQQYIGLD